jgi:cell division septation protein DedD
MSMQASLYAGPERRRTSRTAVKVITYVNFQSDNGGLLTNISEGGLCFHAVGPVLQPRLRIGFSAGDHRIEVDGELAWTDETKKKGGLRFTSLSTEMREQILDWLRTSTTSSTAKTKRIPAWVTHPSRALTESRLHKSSARDSPALPEELRHSRKARLPGFFPGLLTGLLSAVLLAGAFLLGERFGSKPTAQTPSSPTTWVAVPYPERPSVPMTPGGQSQQERSERAAPAIPSSSSASVAPSTTIGVALNSLPISHALRSIPQLERADLPARDAQTPQLEPAMSPFVSVPAVGLTQPGANYDAREPRVLAPPYVNSSAGKYFDVGKFRNMSRANEAVDKLGQSGFHAILVHSRFLWTNSYHVLVGPYSSPDEVETARYRLKSRGISPQALPTKSKRLSLPPMTLYGSDLTIKDCLVTWELNSPDATIEFFQGRNVVAKSKGRWEKRNFVFKSDAVVTQENERGPKTLEEIRSAGMDQALVLDGSVVRVYLGQQ